MEGGRIYKSSNNIVGMSKLILVITTIQRPTRAVRELANCAARVGGNIYVIGDKSGPASFAFPCCEFIALADQLELPYRLVEILPVGHYARKNIGYLLAVRDGAACIYETDDDNAPMSAWAPREAVVRARRVSGSGWINVYRFFSKVTIWPRGLPLDAIRRPADTSDIAATTSDVPAPIQQGLVNGSPDVDAIWRLSFGDDFLFRDGPSIFLPAGAWCPFNSQSTWWFPAAYPLLYLPSHCSFRVTDIWRSLVAQRCLWELGTGLVFHGPEVVQDRNPHDLMRDFEAEVPGYLKNRIIAEKLEDLSLRSGPEAVVDNLWSCYEMLVSEGLLPSDELDLVRAWLDDVKGSYAR